MTVEEQLKSEILSRYKSIAAFTSAIGVPNSTLNSVFKRGISNAGISTMIKVFDALDLDVESIQTGTLEKKKSCIKSHCQTIETKLGELSVEEQTHIKKYRLLDPYGKEAVDGVLDVESRRCEEERQKQAAILREQWEQMDAAEEIAPEDIYSIPLYSLPMSAGTGQEAGQEYPEDFLLKKRPPRGTSFIARVSGNSMEPTYHDGDLVFIHATVDICPGQTGAFLMDGQLWIKELGDGVLISHNPDYEPRQFTEDIRCQGLVLGVCDESYFEESSRQGR